MEGCCPSCGSHNLVEDDHEGQALVVCSDCGHVAEDSAQANLTLNYGDLLTNDGPTGIVLRAHDAGDLAGRAGTATGYFRGAVSQYRWRDLARATAGQLALTRQHRDLLVDLVDLIQEHGYQCTFGWEPLIAACAYIVLRQQELPFTLRDVAVATNIHVHKIARCMKHVLLSCSIHLPPNNLRALVTRHLTTLLSRAPPSAPGRPAPGSSFALTPASAANHPVTHAALRLLDYIQATNTLSGFSPLSVAAAVIRLAVEAHVPVPREQQWLLAHAMAALNLPCHSRIFKPTQALKASLVSLAPLLPHLPPNDPLAMVRNLPDVLRLSTLLASLAYRPSSPTTCPSPANSTAALPCPAAPSNEETAPTLPQQTLALHPLRAWPAAHASGQVYQQGQQQASCCQASVAAEAAAAATTHRAAARSPGAPGDRAPSSLEGAAPPQQPMPAAVSPRQQPRASVASVWAAACAAASPAAAAPSSAAKACAAGLAEEDRGAPADGTERGSTSSLSTDSGRSRPEAGTHRASSAQRYSQCYGAVRNLEGGAHLRPHEQGSASCAAAVPTERVAEPPAAVSSGTVISPLQATGPLQGIGTARQGAVAGKRARGVGPEEHGTLPQDVQRYNLRSRVSC